jgi:hypothetical protein
MNTNDIEEAKKIIEEERQSRLKDFQLEFDALCIKYNCSLNVGQIIITAN